MTEHLTRLVVERRAEDLTRDAARSRLARETRTARRQPRHVRASTARLLVSLASRLDDRLATPVPVREAR